MVPLGIDREKLMIQLGRLHDHLRQLEEIKQAISTEKSGDILLSAAERVLQLAIQDCLNIGSHIISAKGFKRADTYKDVFIILQEKGVVSEELGKAMAHLASFRNRLVHIYWEVKSSEVLEKIRDTDIFKKYAEELTAFIK